MTTDKRDDGQKVPKDTSISIPEQSNEDPNKQGNVNPTTRNNNKSEMGLETFKKKRNCILYSCWVVVFLLGVAVCVVGFRRSKDSLWQWSLIITALLGGPIPSRCLLHIIKVLLENEGLLKINVVYYIVELVESAWYVLWFGMVLLAWIWATYGTSFRHLHVKRTIKSGDAKSIVTTALISLVVGSILWLIKNLLIIMMKSSFHIRVFFNRIREVCRHHQAMKALTEDSLCLKRTGRGGKDKDKDKDDDDVPNCGLCKIMSDLKGSTVCEVKKDLRIDKQDLEDVCQDTVSCWEVEAIMKEIRTIEFAYNSNPEQPMMKVIDSQKKAREAADDVLFKSILPPESQNESSFKVDDEKLSKHMKGKGASKMLELFENAGFEQITKEEVQKYMVWAFKYHRALVRGLRDNRALFRDLNRCLNLTLVIATIVLWLIMANETLKKIIFVIGSGIVASAFLFGNFCKMMLDNFAFVFLVHPFDAGDYCLIDDTSVIIENVNLLATVALTLDDQQIHFPNVVLFRKNIINYTRSPNTSDSVVFFLDRRTTEEEIKTLKDDIKSYIEKHPRIWDEEHRLLLDYDSVDSEKIKATLNIKHLFKFYVPSERKIRKSNFIEYLNTKLPNYRTENSDKETTIPQDAGKNSKVKKSKDIQPDREC